MNRLYQYAGISKQGAYQYRLRQERFTQQVQVLITEAEALRSEHPGCGIEKMYYTLKPTFIGRDRFIELFLELGFRLKRKKNYRRTTYSAQKYYPNLIAGMHLDGPSQVWQSDITYIAVKDCFYYAVFIIDVYTREIVGYRVSNHMRATANLAALHMALEGHEAPRFHHSDRGSQYVYTEYVALLKDLKSEISMGLCAQDNAYAERINRTIKEEYLHHWKPQSFTQLKYQVDKAVAYYNTKRPHNKLKKVPPIEFRKQWKQLPMNNKPIVTIFELNTN